MNSKPEPASATGSALALSVLYVQEIALLLAKIRRMVYIAVGASVVLMATPILVLSGLTQSVEEFVPFEEELLAGLVLVVLIIPTAAYFALRSTKTMDRWQNRFDGLAYALRFEAQKPQGETPAIRLANQALGALNPSLGEVEPALDAKNFTNCKLGSESYEVVIPDGVTKKLSDHRGAIVAKRFEGKPVLAKDLTDLMFRLRSSGVRLWRVLVVSDREFPPETSDYHASLMDRSAFPIDLVEETDLGFSVVSLGS